jgi:cytochrome c-type biogenesis protein CcmH
MFSKSTYLSALVLTLSCWLTSAQATIETYPFDTVQQEQDYNNLIYELRCLVCQNQNLADSNAELAQDLRKQVHTMLVEQKQDKASVVKYMVDRYGDFVLYNPPVKFQTFLLWGGPFVFLILGFWWLFKIITQAGKTANTNNKATHSSDTE